MLFSILRAVLWILLMGTVVLSTLVLNKLKIVQKFKILKFIPVVIVLVLFFVPFEEMISFSSPDTAFSGTTIGTPLVSTAHGESHGFFFKDKLGKYTVVFFTQTDGKYKKCAEDENELVFSEQKNGVTVELLRAANTDDLYLLLFATADGFTAEDTLGTEFEIKRAVSEKSAVSYAMAAITPNEGYTLIVNGESLQLPTE